jgi:hypothetical protein
MMSINSIACAMLRKVWFILEPFALQFCDLCRPHLPHCCHAYSGHCRGECQRKVATNIQDTFSIAILRRRRERDAQVSALVAAMPIHAQADKDADDYRLELFGTDSIYEPTNDLCSIHDVCILLVGPFPN